MTSTRNTLQRIAGNLEESMGVRDNDLRPKLSPVPSAKDIGRRPIRNFGRVDVNNVIPDPDQPRQEFDDGALERLSQSIRDKGQLSPIRVRWSAELNKWIIISGERRWRATRLAGLPEIECYFHDEPLSPNEILEQALIENLLREDLSAIEEAQAYAKLIEMNDWTGKQLADALRIDPAQVSRALALLKLPEDVQDKVAAGTVSPRAAYQISRISDDETRRQLVADAEKGVITHEDAARVAQTRRGKPRRTLGHKQTFVTETGWKIIATCTSKSSYHELESAVQEVLEEVRLRIKSRISLS